YGIFCGGAAYGDKEIPIPYGGSAGGIGNNTTSGAGGGGVEIVATGSVTLGARAGIYSEGGSVNYSANQVAGGGAGGSVRIIAGTTFSNSGIIDVNGGRGGNSSGKFNVTGGGGGGGRVSVYYGSTYTNTGSITAKGGPRGIYDVNSDPNIYGKTISDDGQDGTLFNARYDANGVPMKASAPTPRSVDKMVYAPVADTNLMLKWYSGYYNGTAATDTLYFGTSSTPVALIAAKAVTARGQEQAVEVNIAPNTTYYWRITTTSGAITTSSDIWSFKTVDWQCSDPGFDTLVWDTGYYYNCFVDFDDFVDLGRYWNVSIPVVGGGTDGVDMDALRIFADEWLVNTRTTP
ncbi:MAG: hypothetical protein WCE45_00095, partial [Sedimentisphaerales bacterium]